MNLNVSRRQWGITTTALNVMMRFLYALLSVRSREEPLLTKWQEDMSTSIVFGYDSKKWCLHSFRKSKPECVGRTYLFTVQTVLFPLCLSHFCRVEGADMLSRIYAHVRTGSIYRHKTAFKFHLTFLRFIFSRWWRLTLPSSDLWHREGWCVITDISDKHTVSYVFPDEEGSTFLWGVGINLPDVLFHG